MSPRDMEYTRLSGTGLEISRLCLGWWNFGSEEPWMVGNEVEILAILDRLEVPKSPSWSERDVPW